MIKFKNKTYVQSYDLSGFETQLQAEEFIDFKRKMFILDYKIKTISKDKLLAPNQKNWYNDERLEDIKINKYVEKMKKLGNELMEKSYAVTYDDEIITVLEFKKVRRI